MPGRVPRVGLRPLDAVEELRQFADVLDGVLQGLYLCEGLSPLAVDGGQVVAQRVERVGQGPHPQLLPLAGLPPALGGHPHLGALGQTSLPGAGQVGGGEVHQAVAHQAAAAAVGGLRHRRARGRGVGLEGGRRGQAVRRRDGVQLESPGGAFPVPGGQAAGVLRTQSVFHVYQRLVQFVHAGGALGRSDALCPPAKAGAAGGRDLFMMEGGK